MTEPALSKTYEFDINNAVAADATQANGSSDATNDRKELMLGIKNAFINGGIFTTPWVVRGSSNAVTAGHDAVDRWSTIADLRWNVGTVASPPAAAHSWIILYNAGLDVELLIDCANAANTDGACIIAMISHRGFGAANGGVDGTTTTRPFALDECELRDGVNNNFGSWSGNDTAVGRTWKWHVMGSTDGEVWNVLIYQADVLTAFWRFEVPANPPAGWASPIVAIMSGESDDVTNADNDAFTSIQTGSRFALLARDRREDLSQNNSGIRILSWGWTNNGSARMGHGRLSGLVHPISGNPMLWPAFYVSTAAAVNGRLGRAHDLWLRHSGVGGGVGDTYPNNPATPQFLVLSGTTAGFILPWDGATAPQTS